MKKIAIVLFAVLLAAVQALAGRERQLPENSGGANEEVAISILDGAAVLEMDCRYIDFPCIGIQFADRNVKVRMGTYLEVKRDGDAYLVKVKYDAERFRTIDEGIEAYLKELFRDFYADGHRKYGKKVWKAFVREGGLKLFIDTAREHIDDEFLDSPFNEIYG